MTILFCCCLVKLILKSLIIFCQVKFPNKSIHPLPHIHLFSSISVNAFASINSHLLCLAWPSLLCTIPYLGIGKHSARVLHHGTPEHARDGERRRPPPQGGGRPPPVAARRRGAAAAPPGPPAQRVRRLPRPPGRVPPRARRGTARVRRRARAARPVGARRERRAAEGVGGRSRAPGGSARRRVAAATRAGTPGRGRRGGRTRARPVLGPGGIRTQQMDIS